MPRGIFQFHWSSQLYYLSLRPVSIVPGSGELYDLFGVLTGILPSDELYPNG